MGLLKRLVPATWKHALKRQLLEALSADMRVLAREECVSEPPPGALKTPDNRPVLESLYTPWQQYPSESVQALSQQRSPSPTEAGGLPLPPEAIMMGYHGNLEQYLREGRQTAEFIRDVLARQGASISGGARILDWGCATGRVLRHFLPEAEAGEFWGVDQHAACMVWAKERLSPPFHFLTGSALPHLAFEERYFDLIYGISVMTHLEHLCDQWLMELRRLLKSGGHCFLTVHTEASLKTFREVYWPPWLDPQVDQAALEGNNISILPGRGDWAITYVFYREAYLREEWGRYFEVVEVFPAEIPYAQTGVLLRKR